MTLNGFCVAKTFFLLMVYGRVGDGDKYSYEAFNLGGLIFMLPVT